MLARGGVPDVSYHLLSDHYNRTRTGYYRRLAETSASPSGRPEVFIEYAMSGLVDGLRQQVGQIRSQHRERLAMDLVMAPEPVPKLQLRTLSEPVASSYKGKTEKTVTRDVNELSKMGPWYGSVMVFGPTSGYWTPSCPGGGSTPSKMPKRFLTALALCCAPHQTRASEACDR